MPDAMLLYSTAEVDPVSQVPAPGLARGRRRAPSLSLPVAATIGELACPGLHC
jgi:hypothetical protein